MGNRKALHSEERSVLWMVPHSVPRKVHWWDHWLDPMSGHSWDPWWDPVLDWLVMWWEKD
jgi:hypothetical protein